MSEPEPSETHAPTGRVVPSPFAAAAVGCGLSAIGVAIAAAWLYACPTGSRVSGAVLAGALTALLLGLLLTRPRFRGSLGAVACLAPLGWLPVLFIALGLAHEPIVITRWRCGTGQAAAVLFAPLFVVPALAAAAFLATRLASPGRLKWVRAGAAASLVLVVLATLVAALRMTRPDPDRYVASLPLVKVLRVDDSLALADGTRLTYRSAPLGPVATSKMTVGDKTCTLQGVEGASFVSASCPPLFVRHDVNGGLWVANGDGQLPIAFFEHEKRSRDVSTDDVARSIAPPIGWTLGGGLGLVLGVAAAVFAYRVERKRAAFRGIEGVVQPDGWVVVPGAPPVPPAQVAGLLPGPAVMSVRWAERSSYRDFGRAEVHEWRAGTLAQVLSELEGRATALYALSLTSGLACAAPLILSGLGGSR